MKIIKLHLFIILIMLLFIISCKEIKTEEYTRSYELKSIGVNNKYNAYGSYFLFVGTITLNNEEYYTGFVKNGNTFARFNLLVNNCILIEDDLIKPSIQFTMRGIKPYKVSYDEINKLNNLYGLKGKIKIILPKGSIIENFKL